MPIESRYLLSAAMDVEPGKDAIFNELYNDDHIRLLRQVPGVVSVARFKTEELTLVIGGGRRTIVVDNEPAYRALWEIESPDVLTSGAWAKAVDSGRWPTEGRPLTTNRRFTLHRRVYP
jgi:hypothetical protein